MEKRSFCFFIMPFTPESHFLYQYLKEHIEKTPSIQCERADETVGETTLNEKIINYIRLSDVIIADCSGGNPNVFYELGFARCLDKEIIYITKDSISQAPSDIRDRDFIRYDTNKPKEFIELLDKTLKKIIFENNDNLYRIALDYYDQFKKDTKIKVKSNTKSIFIKLIKADRIPQSDDTRILKQFFLPKIIANSSNEKVMKKITEWIH
jgi:nucleoside 2-deoxyribosyltransferase